MNDKTRVLRLRLLMVGRLPMTQDVILSKETQMIDANSLERIVPVDMQHNDATGMGTLRLHM